MCRGLSLTFTSLLAIYLAFSLNRFLFTDTQDHVLYGVIFDAGSTGSRARVYKVLQNASGGLCRYKLVSEEAFTVEPGLSEFARFPHASVAYLRPLLDQARACIPKHKRALTPLVLRATAGLRLLPERIANTLLQSVHNLLNTSGFHLASQEVVSIMDGIDEGFFAWISLLFLNQQSCLASYHPQSPFTEAVIHHQAIFDLGGASFQLTFGVTTDAGPSEYVHNIPSVYLGTQFSPPSGKFFARSYLGLGLVTAMHSMFLHSSNRSTASISNHLLSPCFPTNFTGSWNHGGKKWTVSHGFEGRQSLPGNVFNECFETAVNVITERELGANRVKDLEGLKQLEIQATSFMCSKTEEAAKLLISGPADGRVPVQWYFDAARKACSTPLLERPFLCTELTYISALLSHGFGLPVDKCLNLNRTIGDIEIGWPVGFLVDILLRCFLTG
ncbi:Ectonucleoside triphosphate diphosphohydrolase [Echinococcus granulosus]|uniref:Ectonucleoside triphosphate diphosphohydrolase n=1 Tax=Echinococcus granulosus TaxID=6210 RepID=W6UTK0_ECHGR|nr:Ectonucleoside triphosphate diphosphohydrolase [Echinococcus granulosus]EUB63971.1 Ectonucleoside triphosphate diphosphohydrolase [Echinococcus granulosus]